MLVPFPHFAPDQSRFNPQASRMVKNARPTADGWGPMQDFNPVSEALPAAPRGGRSVRADDGAWRLFAGTATNLYEASSTDYTWTEISRVTDDYNLPDGAFWRFERWGNYLIATADGSDFPQYIELDAGSQFANLTNASFEAGGVFSVGDFLVFFDIDGDKRKLKWSAVNDIFSWTPGESGADEQTLPDGGSIQAGLQQTNYAILVQEEGIRQMISDPESGLVFRFPPLVPVRGAFAPRSVVNIGPNDFVYLAKDGFYRGVQAQPIGAEKVNRWFFDQIAQDKIDLVSGFADQFEKQVIWRYEDEDGENHLIGYDWQLDRWFQAEQDVVDIFGAATVGYTLEELDTFGTLETLPFSLDSREWQGGVPSLGGFDTDNKFGFFSGDNLEATIDTERKALNWPRRAITDKIIVLSGGDAEVAISATEQQDDSDSFGSYLTRYNGNPFINSRTSGRWHKFRVKIPAATSWDNASALDVAFVDGGMR